MNIDPKVLISDEVAPPSPEEKEALDGIIRDCEGDPYKAALTLFRLFALQSTISQSKEARMRRRDA